MPFDRELFGHAGVQLGGCFDVEALVSAADDEPIFGPDFELHLVGIGSADRFVGLADDEDLGMPLEVLRGCRAFRNVELSFRRRTSPSRPSSSNFAIIRALPSSRAMIDPS